MISILYVDFRRCDMKKIIIIGAGPAGLTAAYELLDGGRDCAVTVF